MAESDSSDEEDSNQPSSRTTFCEKKASFDEEDANELSAWTTVARKAEKKSYGEVKEVIRPTVHSDIVKSLNVVGFERKENCTTDTNLTR